MVFAVRETVPQADTLSGLPELRIAGLPDSAARELLTSVAGSQLNPLVTARVVAETGGNPLAMIEIGQELTPAQWIGDSPLPDPIPLGRQLEQLYRREIRALPPDTQTLLLTAAAGPTSPILPN